MRDLFAHDNLSDPVPRFAPAAPETEERVRQVLAAFGFTGHVGPVEQAGGAEVNSSNFRVKVDGGTFVVKRLPGSADRSLTELRLAMQRRLGELGVPTPGVVQTADAEDLLDADGERWCVLRFIEGDYFSGSANELAPTAAMVGRLLAACGEAVPGDGALPRLEYLDPTALSLLAEVEAARRSWPSVFGPTVADALEGGWSTIIAARQELVDHANALAALRAVPAHIDLHPHNLLLRGGRVVAVLDFDSLALQPREVAAAFAVFKLVRQHAVYAALGPRPDAIAEAGRAFADAIHAQLPVVRPSDLSLATLAKAEVFRRVLDILGRTMHAGDTSWTFDLVKQVRGLREIDVVLRDAD